MTNKINEEFYGSYDHKAQPIYKAPLTNKAELQAFKESLAAGMDANTKNGDGIAPIHYAAIHGYSDCIEVLFKAGADLDQKDKFGDTALHIAAEYNDLKTISKLIEYGADVNLDSEGREQLPLTICVISGNIEGVKMLLEAGALAERMVIGGIPDDQQKACVNHINEYFGEIFISNSEN